MATKVETKVEKFNTPTDRRRHGKARAQATVDLHRLYRLTFNTLLVRLHEVSGKLASKFDGEVSLVCFVERFGPNLKRQPEGKGNGQTSEPEERMGEDPGSALVSQILMESHKKFYGSSWLSLSSCASLSSSASPSLTSQLTTR